MHYGNLQKIRDGKRTFGITPDIPGGYVTPETLEKIAKVAKKYNAVLKLTAGQRILITNLKEEDLANVWEERKGLFDFYKLAQLLDERYAIVLVGLTEKQLEKLPKNIVGIQHTSSQEELAGIYTAADVLVNPSVEETFGMTQIEAHACGTPSIVYENTACEEIARQNGNIVVPQDVNAIYKVLTSNWLAEKREDHNG